MYKAMTDVSKYDSGFLKEALKLARKGIGWTNPNPMVGAILVKDGKIIAKAYHKRVGLPHAEIEVLRAAKESVKGVTLYVNLEPCSHFGRTPPCVSAIIHSGIGRVVCSTLDPNPKVHGKGVKALQKAGVEVTVGLLENEARILNEAFFTFHEKNRPFVAIKFAASLDGKIATRTGDSKWITNKQARAYARKLRSYYQAVLVGINTLITDNPHLGVRKKGRKNPLRIIIDSKLKIPVNSQVLRDSNVLIITTISSDREKAIELKKRNISLVMFDTETIPFNALLEELRKREIISVLVEGGGNTIGRFVDEKLVDKVYAFVAPILIGGEKSAGAVGGEGVKDIKDSMRLINLSFKHFGDNFLVIGSII